MVSVLSLWRCLGTWTSGGLLVLCCHPALAAPQLEIGTLFYTPAQRMEISRLRQPPLGVGASFSTSTRVSGVVHRAGGKGTVWVNDEPLAEGVSHSPQIRGVDAVVDGTRLRVGESIDKTSGTRRDVVAPGAVTVKRKQ